MPKEYGKSCLKYQNPTAQVPPPSSFFHHRSFKLDIYPSSLSLIMALLIRPLSEEPEKEIFKKIYLTD